jgi:hypothetical protein
VSDDFQPDYQNTILTGSIMDGVGWKGYMTDIDTMLRFSYVTVKEKGHSQSNHDGSEKHNDVPCSRISSSSGKVTA